MDSPPPFRGRCEILERTRAPGLLAWLGGVDVKESFAWLGALVPPCTGRSRGLRGAIFFIYGGGGRLGFGQQRGRGALPKTGKSGRNRSE